MQLRVPFWQGGGQPDSFLLQQVAQHPGLTKPCSILSHFICKLTVCTVWLVCLFVSCMRCGNNLTEGFPLPHSLPKVLTSSEMHGVLPGSGPASPSSLLQIFPGLAALCLLWLVGLIAYHLLLGIPTAAYKLNGQASSQDHTAFMRWHQSLLKVRGLSHPTTTFTFSTSRWVLAAILWLISVILFPENISNFSPVMKFWWWAGW